MTGGLVLRETVSGKVMEKNNRGVGGGTQLRPCKNSIYNSQFKCCTPGLLVRPLCRPEMSSTEQ